jgi:hypothetical protein
VLLWLACIAHKCFDISERCRLWQLSRSVCCRSCGNYYPADIGGLGRYLDLAVFILGFHLVEEQVAATIPHIPPHEHLDGSGQRDS